MTVRAGGSYCPAGMNPTLQQDNYTYAGVPSAANYSATELWVTLRKDF